MTLLHTPEKKNLYRLPWSANDNPIGWIEITDICNIHCDGCYRMIMGEGHKPLEKIKEEQGRKLEVDTKQNAFWMSNLFDAYYNDYDPHLILDKEKQIDGLTAKRLQDIAKKYIDINTYIRVVLKPEQTSQSPMKAF